MNLDLNFKALSAFRVSYFRLDNTLLVWLKKEAKTRIGADGGSNLGRQSWYFLYNRAV